LLLSTGACWTARLLQLAAHKALAGARLQRRRSTAPLQQMRAVSR